jgi:hypothetical protein
MKTDAQRAWIMLGALVGVVLALLWGTSVIIEQRRYRAVAMLPKPAAVERYEALQHAAPPAPEVSHAVAPEKTVSDAETLAQHARLLERYDRDVRTSDAWNEVMAAYRDGVIRPLDPATWAPFRVFMDGQQGFLTSVREAAAAGGPIYPLDFSQGPSMPLPHVAPVRQMATLLGLDALYHAANGDYDTYLADVTAMLDFANALAEEPLLISQIVRIRIGDTVFDTVGAGPTGAELSLEHVRRLQTMFHAAAAREPFVEGLAGDAQIGLASFELARQGDYYTVGAQPEQLAAGRNPSAADLLFARVYASPFGQPLIDADEEAYAEGLKTLVDASRLPYYEAQARIRELGQEIEGLPERRYMARTTLKRLLETPRSQAGLEAMMDLMRIGLELERYQVEEGELPENLERIQERLGGPGPVDPFTGTSYIYRVSGNGFQLYSVGRNQADDGGIRQPARRDIVWRE